MVKIELISKLVKRHLKHELKQKKRLEGRFRNNIWKEFTFRQMEKPKRKICYLTFFETLQFRL